MRQKVDIYSARAKALGDVLGISLGTKGEIDPRALSELNESDIQTVTKELALTLLILQEMLSTCKSFDIKINTDLSVLLLSNFVRQESLSPFLINAFISNYNEFLETVETSKTDLSMLEVLMKWREIQALSSSTPITFTLAALKDFPEFTLSRVRNLDRNLDEFNLESFQSNLRLFLSNEWLYPWVTLDDKSTIGQRYGLIFKLAGIDKEVEMNNVIISNVLSALDSADIERHLKELIGTALNRVNEAIELNGYEAIFDISDDGGSLLGSVNDDLSSNINIIPGSNTSKCRPILFAFAHGGSSSIRNTIRLVRTHLIRCQGTTKVVIFFAPLAHIVKGLEESAGDLEAQIHDKHLSAFIPIAIYRNQLSVISCKKN